LKIQLINPGIHLNPRSLTGLRPAPPIGLAYIAAVLRRAGHDVTVLDSLTAAPTQMIPDGRIVRLGLTNEQIVERIDPEASAIGITNMWTFSWPAVRAMIKSIREHFPDKTIVCGGEHFTSMAEQSMKTAPIDYIVMGEGEEVAVELFGKLGSGEPFDPASIGGVCWRRGDEIVQNPRAARKRAIDELPWPAWDLFDLETYHRHDFVTGVKYGMTVPILATRGCPYQCTFCSSPQMWTTRWYARDPIDVVDEIEFYQKTYGAMNFPFQDLTAFIKKQWILDFCHELLRRKMNIVWQMPTGTRLEVIDDEVAHLLARTNGRTLGLAPESGSEETRRLIKKAMKTESLMRALKASTAHKLNVTVFLILGFPHDTEESFADTVSLVRQAARLGVDDVAVGFFYPLPGTALYTHLVQSGRLQPDDEEILLAPIFGHDAYLTEERNFCEHVSARRLTAYKWWLIANFYLTAWVTHPMRPLHILRNVLLEREGSKMETFLLGRKRAVGKPLRNLWSRTDATVEERALP
jgi:radical SAM superfamily enzyme YgiQ (UPF0313 family)